MLSLLYPTQHPTFDHPSSFKLVSSWTQTFVPHSWRLDKLGLLPVSASYGVMLLRAQVDVWFFSQFVCSMASPHKNLGRLLWWSIAWTCSRMWWLSASATPLCLGVSCVVRCHLVPCAWRWPVNSSSRYSPPRSEHNCLILMLYWVATQALKCLYNSKVWSFLRKGWYESSMCDCQWKRHSICGGIWIRGVMAPIHLNGFHPQI